MKKTDFVMLCSVLLLTGCVPKMQIISPYIEGEVVDAVTKKPLKNVLLSGENGTLKSDAKGKFKIPEKRTLTLALPVGGIFRIEQPFSLQKEGYEKLSCECDVLTTQEGCFNVHLELSPLGTSYQHKNNSSNGIECATSFLFSLPTP